MIQKYTKSRQRKGYTVPFGILSPSMTFVGWHNFFYMIIISLLLKGLDLVHFNQFNHFNYSVKESKGKTLRKSSEAQQVVVGRLSNTADR